jgi:hypothetical protein
VLAKLCWIALAAACLLAAPVAPASAAITSVVWAVGDADASPDSQATANRITGQIDRFLYLGDVYENGTAAEFANNFDPVWGRFKAIGSPTPGNHEWGNRATGYDPYWGARAPQTNGGHFYSVVENGWEVISLNSQESMAPGSPQYEWLKQKLAGDGNCRIAFFHRPRFTAPGTHVDAPDVQPLWELMANKVRYVLNGHSHNMQRANPVAGITQLISGAGGHGLYVANPDSRFAFINATDYGVLRLKLNAVGSNPDGGATLEHQFIAADDGTVLDSGSGSCSPQTANPRTLFPQADARVDEATPGTNRGSGDLVVDGGADPDMESYLRFSVSGLTGPVQSAKLRLYLTNNSGDAPAVYGTSSSWSESSITWANRPARTTGVIDDKGPVAVNAWVEYDVTPLVTGNGTHSFVLATTSSDGIIANAREGGRPPELVLTQGQAAPPPPATNPEADSRVEEARPNTNFGTASSLWVDGGSDPDQYSYLRFTLSGLTQPVQSAKLRLYLTNGSGNGPALHGTSNSWLETSINWSNDPGPTTGVIDDKGSVGANAWVEYNVKPLVTGNGTYSFVLTTNTTDGVIADSREASRKPELVVTEGQPPPPPPPATNPEADSRVEEANPTTNFGASTSLWVDGGSDPDQYSYLRFTLSGLTQPVQSAKLRLYLTNGSSNGPALYGTSNSWSELSINWSNDPGPTTGVIEDKGSLSANKWVEYNVKPLVTGNGTYSFVLTTNTTDGVIADSREATRKPELVVTQG